MSSHFLAYYQSAEEKREEEGAQALWGVNQYAAKV